MRVNDKCLTDYSLGQPQFEGRLNYKKMVLGAHHSQKGFKERWFKLKANLLFYFKINELGQIEKQPSGLLVLENSCVQYESNAGLPFAFSISFRDDSEKKHVLSAGTEEHVHQWIRFLKEAAYGYWRSQLILLQTKICQLTGIDPLIMYPRFQGSAECVRPETEKPADNTNLRPLLQEPVIEVANLIDL